MRLLVLRELIKALRPIDVAFKLGDVTEVVQCERIIGIEQIGFVEKLLGFGIITLFYRLHTVAVERLYGSRFAAFGNADAQGLLFGMEQRQK